MVKSISIIFCALLFLCQRLCLAQSLFAGKEHLFTEPKKYVTYFTAQAPKIDGHINDKAWQTALWSDYFTNIEGYGKPKPTWNTRVKMLWNDSCLYIAAELHEPHVWATLQQRDTIIYYDNDFEVFYDPDNDAQNYYEIEVNAYNTIFDLLLTKPYRNGGKAIIPWQAAGLQSAVQVQGTLNNPNDTDKSWTVEMSIPFRAASLGNKTNIPAEGTFWRVNFSRVQWDMNSKTGKYVKVRAPNGKLLPEHNWVWSPQGVINMHFPERWGYLYFTRKSAAEKPALTFSLPYSEKQKQYLWYIYYQQKDYHQKNRLYTVDFNKLGIKSSTVVVDNQSNKLKLEANNQQFTALIQGPDKITRFINQDGSIGIMTDE